MSLDYDTHNRAPLELQRQQRLLCWMDCLEVVVATLAKSNPSTTQMKQMYPSIG